MAGGKKKDAEPKAQEAPDNIGEATGLSLEVEKGFRRLTDKHEQDLTPAGFNKQARVCWLLWAKNSIARRLIQMKTDFLVGDGFSYQAKDADVQKVLDRFWNDPDNNWNLNQFERVQDMRLYGVLALRAFTNTYTGHVKLVPINPLHINDINTDPENYYRPVELVMTGEYETKNVKIIQQDRDPLSKTFGKLVGEAFYFPINKTSVAVFGMSDLFPVADWVDMLDQFIFSTLERIRFLNAYMWDVELKGANELAIRKRLAEIRSKPPKPGTIRVHNDRETWKSLAPDLNAGETETIYLTVLKTILGSMGIPLHWFGSGEETNRATAVAQNDPSFKMFKREQGYVKYTFETILQYVIDQAVIAGTLNPAGKDMSFTVVAPDISSKDNEAAVKALSDLVVTLSVAEERQYLSHEDALEIFRKAGSELGMKVHKMDPQPNPGEDVYGKGPAPVLKTDNAQPPAGV